MAAYVIVQVEVHNAENYAEYAKLSGASVAQYGGRFVVRGGAVEPVEGDWNPQRFVVIEFASIAAARRWYDSPEYGQARVIRWNNAQSQLIFVEGVAH